MFNTINYGMNDFVYSKNKNKNNVSHSDFSKSWVRINMLAQNKFTTSWFLLVGQMKGYIKFNLFYKSFWFELNIHLCILRIAGNKD